MCSALEITVIIALLAWTALAASGMGFAVYLYWREGRNDDRS